jgi:trehalose 6-phosphate synthase
MVREKLPKATIITFWHIPWPNAEAFGACPWKAEILQGLLASTILGFHTRWQCTNFLATVERFIESGIDHENSSITHGGGQMLVRPYPISIEPVPAALARQQPIDICRQQVRRDLRLFEEIHLSVGVERLDYTKGIPGCLSYAPPRVERPLRLASGYGAKQVQTPGLQRSPARSHFIGRRNQCET